MITNGSPAFCNEGAELVVVIERIVECVVFARKSSKMMSSYLKKKKKKKKKKKT